MKYKANQLAALLQGTVEGNPDAEIWKLSRIESGEEGGLTFLANPAYTQYIYTTLASVVIVNRDFSPEKPLAATLIRVDNAYAAFATLLEMYNQTRLDKKGVSEKAFISPGAVIGKDVYIGPFAFVGENAVISDNARIFPLASVGDDTRIGSNTVIYPNATIYHACEIGDHCTIHSGAVIGADGFGFAQNAGNENQKIAQIGNVILEDHVEVGANTTIDRATLGSTVIRRGTKLDNLIQIGHNVEVGENSVIVAQAGIAGSTHLGARNMIGGQVGIIGHLKLGNDVKIGAQAGVSHNIPDGEILLGSPAVKVNEFKRLNVYFRNLPKMAARIEALEKEIKELKNR